MINNHILDSFYLLIGGFIPIVKTLSLISANQLNIKLKLGWLFHKSV